MGVLSLIIDWSCDPSDSACLAKSEQTTAFNAAVENNVFEPRKTAGVDKIVLSGYAKWRRY